MPEIPIWSQHRMHTNQHERSCGTMKIAHWCIILAGLAEAEQNDVEAIVRARLEIGQRQTHVLEVRRVDLDRGAVGGPVDRHHHVALGPEVDPNLDTTHRRKCTPIRTNHRAARDTDHETRHLGDGVGGSERRKKIVKLMSTSLYGPV